MAAKEATALRKRKLFHAGDLSGADAIDSKLASGVYSSTAPLRTPSAASSTSAALTGARWLIPAAGAVALLPQVSSAVALLAGIAIALLLGNPWPARTRALGRLVLKTSIVALGAGMNLAVVAKVGVTGFGYTALGISTAFVVGSVLGKRLGVNKETSLLVTVGTAICGGSAIAAVAPVIHAKSENVSMSLICVFLLNAVALLLFPSIGGFFELSEKSFGLWCALAIHDTSSVVGAATQYGAHALQVATTAKLARALWIVPVAFAITYHQCRCNPLAANRVKYNYPWFIGGFLFTAAAVTYLPAVQETGQWIAIGARRLLTLSLFLIGLGLTRATLRSVGMRPMVQAIALWVTLASLSLLAIVQGWIG